MIVSNGMAECLSCNHTMVHLDPSILVGKTARLIGHGSGPHPNAAEHPGLANVRLHVSIFQCNGYILCMEASATYTRIIGHPYDGVDIAPIAKRMIDHRVPLERLRPDIEKAFNIEQWEWE